MPKRLDIQKILIIGSGPIIIGQACEFDYSGSQACKTLRQEGYQVILINSNPATIMTDPDMADKTYIEPIEPAIIEQIIAKERPDALLPTLGGQTGLNAACALYKQGVLAKYNVELIGASYDAIQKTEDRMIFKEIMESIGVGVLASAHVSSVEAAEEFANHNGFPLIIRPSFTLGGAGGGVACNLEELREITHSGLTQSPSSQVLIEESVIGWKEYELEVMRDIADNVVIVCSMENVDPMGIHTGDSITVAPIQTLSDLEYQQMRNEALKIIRTIGVETGGSNIQFAVDPETGKRVVVEMNPRVSRSSALASKATGFAIAKIAAKLAIGYTLDELPNDITSKTPACFEPAIDYCVTKVPRWDFEKFYDTDVRLTTQMKSVGEVMAIGRTFKESFQKALRSLEQGRFGWGTDGQDRYSYEELTQANAADVFKEEITHYLLVPTAERIFYIRYALLIGMSIDEIYTLTGIDRWFLHNMQQILDIEIKLRSTSLTKKLLQTAKNYGFSDQQIAHIYQMDESAIRAIRQKQEIFAVFKSVDTCAAEFDAVTPYFYSTYHGEENEVVPKKTHKVMILGGGPNRIGQGIEFDYCCVQAAFALREKGSTVIMVNCNPETVSTDYDTSDTLYFEPLTLENVLEICQNEKPDGVILQFGGQTPLKLALSLEKAGINVLGTSPTAIDLAEDREKFSAIVTKLGLLQPQNGLVRSIAEAQVVAKDIGYPVLVRPSYVLGGRAMEIVYDETSLSRYMQEAVKPSPEHPILIDRFLEDSIEVDVDAVSDGSNCVIGGIMEHIERAGIHSGDSACALPPFSLSPKILNEIRRQTKLLAIEIGVVGLLNIQFAIKGEQVYLIEVNPRASRTVPFVSKSIGISLAKIATNVLLGIKLDSLGFTNEVIPPYTAVKEAVFPYIKFSGTDIILGPEMHSTGEVMGIDQDFAMAFAKSQSAAGSRLPLAGNVLLTIADKDKPLVVELATKLRELGFGLVATKGTAEYLQKQGILVDPIAKIGEGSPDIVDEVKNGRIQFIINRSLGKGPLSDGYKIRREALMEGVPIATTIEGAVAAVKGIEQVKLRGMQVKAIQEYHQAKKNDSSV